MQSNQPTGSRRRCRYPHAALVALALLMGGLVPLALGGPTLAARAATQSVSVPAAAAVQQSKLVAVPVAVPKGATGTGAKPAASSVWFELVLKANGARYCLDANDVGPSAGHNGGKVQLWQCTGTKNQYWEQYSTSANIPVREPFFRELRNERYPNECLNARTPIGNGSPTQLWACTAGANELWDYLPDSSLLSAWGVANGSYYVLDARAPGIGNGDVVQIWTGTGGANQVWWVRRA